MTITQPHRAYCDFYHFGTSRDTPISEATLHSKLDHLYRFIALFKEKAYSLIREAEISRFILPIQSNIKFNLNEVNVKDIDILKHGDIRRFYLGDDFDNDYLTGKEIEVLVHLHMGKRLIDIAKILFISEKTVEKHVENIKNKLKCRTMFELGAITNNLGISNFKI